jgi:hypothetical protein
VQCAEHLEDHLKEFTFCFDRRTLASCGALFDRMVQRALQIEPVPFVK